MEERAPANHDAPEEPDPSEELRVFARLLGEDDDPPATGRPAEPGDAQERDPDPGGESEDEEEDVAPAPRGSLPPAPPAPGEREPTDHRAAAPPPPPPRKKAGRKASAPPRLVARRYEILHALGEGPRGRTFTARDHDRQGREMVLHVLPPVTAKIPGFRALLREHLELLRALPGEAIVKPRDGGRPSGGPAFLTRDHVRGESLHRLLERKGVLRPGRAIEIARQILAALEHVHAAGLTHGGLDPESVLLEERVPETETNPHGVAVRLVDTGLAGLLAEDAPAPGVDDDLRDTAGLLVELLLGTRPATAPGQWVGCGRAPGTAALSKRTRHAIDTALHADPALRFPSARAFRLALEGTPEWRPETARRRHLTLLYGALVVVTAVAIGLAGRGGDPVQAGPGTPPAAVPDAEMEAALREARAAETEWRARFEAGDREQAELRREGDVLRNRIVTAEEARNTLAGELQAAQTEAALLAAQLRAAGEVAAELEATRLAALRAGDPNHVVALGFDRILDRAEAGAGLDARARWLALEKDPLQGGDPVPGGELLTAFTTTAAALERAPLASDPLDTAALLGEAKSGLAEATTRLRTFLASADPWLALPRADGAAPDRFGRLDRALTRQRRALTGAEDALALRLEERWRELLDGKPDRAPGEVVAVAAWFDDGRLVRFVERFALHVQRVSETDGVLDLAGLRNVDSLGAWAATVEADAALAASHAGREVLLHRFARQWYEGSADDAGPPADAVVFQGPAPGAPTEGWRADLALRVALVGADSPFPGPPGTRAVYRTLTPEGTVSWQLVQVLEDDAPPEGVDRSRLVHQSFFDAEGMQQGERSLRVVQRGKKFFEQDLRRVEVLDLGRRAFRCARRSWWPSAGAWRRAPHPPAW